MVLSCSECGAAIDDVARHAEWHEEIRQQQDALVTKVEAQLQLIRDLVTLDGVQHDLMRVVLDEGFPVDECCLELKRGEV